ncbi:MAG TPA: metalloregulator ArsR/SmtB family transcription factor [Alphaproteobacteria bacterium]|nr:metalloregulator ArsR/SmtB family transcription factor [Alphaproteobacteria bacterium]
MPTYTNPTPDPPSRDRVFHAVADPNRRRILEILREGERTAGQIVERFDVSFAAVSQHLKILLESGLVSRRVDGRYRVYAMRPEAIKTVHDWSEGFRDFWEGRIDRLAKLLDEEP